MPELANDRSRPPPQNSVAFQLTISMTSESPNVDASSTAGDHERLEAARREKMRRIEELGFDPWGGRFDGREAIQSIRQRLGEVKFQPENGQAIDVPDPHSQGAWV